MTDDTDRFLAERFTKGALFENKYRIDGIIGSGNFAHVIRARHEEMDRDVAIKILKPDMLEANPDLTKRFVKEVKLVSQLHHPNLVGVFDFGHTDEGLDYMVLEYVPGRPLDEVLDEEGYMPIERGTHIAFQILSALEHAHVRGIVHRDLKPGNVMLGDMNGMEDVAKILDFGVAKLIDEEPKDDEGPITITRRKSTRFIGTPIYMSPEQVLGEKVVPASDFYSLGLILYEMYTGDPPLKATNVAAVARLHIDESPLPMELIDRLPNSIQRVIRIATDRYPEQRFQSASEFIHALSAATGMDSELSEVEIAPGGDKPPKALGGLDERTSEATEDFFINQPRALTDTAPEVAADRPVKTTTKRRPKVATPEAESKRRERKRQITDNLGAGSGLELDIERVRKVDHRARPRQTTVHSTTKTTPWATVVPIASLGFVAFVLSTYLMGAFSTPTSGVVRFIVALVPALAAYLWTTFTQVGRPASGEFANRWLLPTSLHMCYLFAILVGVAFLFFPNHAAFATSESAVWFTTEEHGGIVDIAKQVGGLFSRLFQFADEILPW